MSALVVGAAGYSSAKPGQYDPSWGVPCPTRVWGAAGSTDTVYDASVHTGNCILVTPVGALPNGDWKVVVTQGGFTVTSTAAESTSMTYNYFICGN